MKGTKRLLALLLTLALASSLALPTMAEGENETISVTDDVIPPVLLRAIKVLDRLYDCLNLSQSVRSTISSLLFAPFLPILIPFILNYNPEYWF